MNNKKVTIFENNSGLKREQSFMNNYVVIKETGTGKVLFRGKNKVLVSGSEFNALKDFNFDIDYSGDTTFLDTIPSYDTALKKDGHALDEPVSKHFLNSTSILNVVGANVKPGDDIDVDNFYNYFTRRCYLFCVGIDGCGIENSRVFRVDNTKWIAPYSYASYDPGTGIVDTNVTNCLIPFKVRDSSYDLTNDERKIYFGRSTLNNQISYYFKTFDAMPELVRKYADDSLDLANVTSPDVWGSKRKSDAEVVVKLKMSIDTSDCREYFANLTGTNTARINTISLCTAIPYADGTNADIQAGKVVNTYYQDIRPFTKFNFPNESLINSAKGISISYYLYY